MSNKYEPASEPQHYGSVVAVLMGNMRKAGTSLGCRVWGGKARTLTSRCVISLPRPYILNPKSYTLHPHPEPYILNTKHHILNPEPCILNPVP